VLVPFVRGSLSQQLMDERTDDLAPSDIVYFDDSKANPEPIPELFYRWKVMVAEKTIVVCQLMNDEMLWSDLCPGSEKVLHSS
jgi:hypothetical protein